MLPDGPRRNRVTPLGELEAVAARGLVYGNRGCLHDDEQRIRRFANGRRWIACRLEFKGWHRAPLMQPGRFTELFFLDEATAFASGHRPCALCRRADYERFLEIMASLDSNLRGADRIDRRLHDERLDPRTGRRRLHHGSLETLPVGSFALYGSSPHLVVEQGLRPWSHTGYGAARAVPRDERLDVITPPSLLRVLASDWRPVVPLLHPTGLGDTAARDASPPSG